MIETYLISRRETVRFPPPRYFGSYYTKVMCLFPKFCVVWTGIGDFKSTCLVLWKHHVNLLLQSFRSVSSDFISANNKSDCAIPRNTLNNAILGNQTSRIISLGCIHRIYSSLLRLPVGRWGYLPSRRIRGYLPSRTTIS